jgi:type IV secretion system protein VirB11
VTFLRAVNTRHPGSISAIHADSPERAIDQLALLVIQEGSRMGCDNVVCYEHSSMNLIVQLSRSGGVLNIERLMILDRNRSDSLTI